MVTTALLLAILAAPLAAAIIIGLFLRYSRTWAAGLSVGCSVLGMGLMVYLLRVWDGQPLHVAWEWFALGDWVVSFGFLLDRVAVLMLAVVSGVGLCVQVFSLGYMAEDTGRSRYFAGLSFFVFAMLGLIMAANLIALFVFWELVGLSSYVLINHYFNQRAAALAANKAFMVNRVGDLGMLMGIVACYHFLGTVDLVDLATAAKVQPAPTLLGLLLFCGVVAKSAQMPLHVWLPDAMAGPTPVSALMHAATMVAAGVFLLCRTAFLYTAGGLMVIAWIGAATALYAALCALAQSDIKRVLAYSTLSQLGFMVTGFAVGTKAGLTGDGAVWWGVAAALFHLTTHAFFKALLFLGAGSVIHACGHEQDIVRLGGLRRRLPFTCATFTVGAVAIAGVPFLAAGFFSKEILLFLAWEDHRLIFVILALSSLLTVMYMVRLWLGVFWDKAKTVPAEQAREPVWVMGLALAVLTGLSLIGGWTWLYPPVIASLWHELPHPHGGTAWSLVALSSGLVVFGTGVACFYYRGSGLEDPLQQRFPLFFAGLRQGFYIDRAYAFFVAKVQQGLARVIAFGDRFLISGLLLRGSAGLVGLLGFAVRSTHTGSVPVYLYWFLIGVVLYWAYAFGWL